LLFGECEAEKKESGGRAAPVEYDPVFIEVLHGIGLSHEPAAIDIDSITFAEVWFWRVVSPHLCGTLLSAWPATSADGGRLLVAIL
jgi:hypothetical protein